jgi:hypothetical protein
MLLVTNIRVVPLLIGTPPNRQPQNSHTPHHGPWPQSQNSVMHPLPADPGSRSQPNLRTTRLESHPRIRRGDYPNQVPPTQPYQDHLHGQGPLQGSAAAPDHDTSRRYTQEAPLIHCGWVNEDNMSCKFRGPLDAMKGHFTTMHLSGPQNAQKRCRWGGCEYSRRGKPDFHTMRRDSMWRHVYEIHLNVKYRKVQGT